MTPCRACGSHAVDTGYHGPIRDGRFGSLTPRECSIVVCADCGFGELVGADSVDYASDAYRESVDGAATINSFHALHDPEQAGKLGLIDLHAARAAVVADIGCGAGSFLDLLRGTAARTVAVEPMRAYHEHLARSGHEVFACCADASTPLAGRVDMATCFSVIEHVEDPVQLLREIRTLLKPGGTLVLSTPNARDWLLELLPTDYAAFFYRVVHRSYFTADSLRAAGAAAGFRHVDVRFQHRFDLANALLWLRDRRPSGLGAVKVPASVDAAFRAALEAEGRADYLVATLAA